MPSPLIWYRSLGDTVRRMIGVQTVIDCQMNALGQYSLTTTELPHQVKTSAGSATILPAVPGTYYIIRGFNMGCSILVANTSQGLKIACNTFPDNLTVSIGSVLVTPLTVNTSNVSVNGLAIITNPNTAVVVSNLVAAPDYAQVNLYYDEVRQVD